MTCGVCVQCRGGVLVVEDDPDLREVIGEHLAELGCRVTLAGDGVEALEWLRGAYVPCLILTDLNMPNLDGVGLLRRIRAGGSDRAADIAIVTMSAAEPRDDAAGSIEAHLKKPFMLPDLDAIVGSLCRGGPARCRTRG